MRTLFWCSHTNIDLTSCTKQGSLIVNRHTLPTCGPLWYHCFIFITYWNHLKPRIKRLKPLKCPSASLCNSSKVVGNEVTFPHLTTSVRPITNRWRIVSSSFSASQRQQKSFTRCSRPMYLACVRIPFTHQSEPLKSQ